MKNDKTLDRKARLFEKFFNSEKSFKEIMRANIKEYNAIMDTKIKKKTSLESQKRMIRTFVREIDTITEHHVQKRGITNEREVSLFKREARELFSRENVKGDFFGLARHLQNKYGITEKESYQRSHDLMKIPKSLYFKLKKEEQEALDIYGTP